MMWWIFTSFLWKSSLDGLASSHIQCLTLSGAPKTLLYCMEYNWPTTDSAPACQECHQNSRRGQDMHCTSSACQSMSADCPSKISLVFWWVYSTRSWVLLPRHHCCHCWSNDDNWLHWLLSVAIVIAPLDMLPEMMITPWPTLSFVVAVLSCRPPPPRRPRWLKFEREIN